MSVNGKNNPNYKHGMAHTRPYYVWVRMRQRCNNQHNKDYKWYGGRGIKVCPEWNKSFDNFWKDMGNYYFNEGTIERIDNNGDYSPDNCKWIPIKEQARNTRRTKHITYNGVTKTIQEWSLIFDINYNTLRSRLYSGFSIKDALFSIPHAKNPRKLPSSS